MNTLKCPSCGGTLEKEGAVYVCQNCGETFKDKTENFSLQDYTNHFCGTMNINYCSNNPNDAGKDGTVNSITDIMNWLNNLKQFNENNPFIILESENAFIQTMYESEKQGYVVQKSTVPDILLQAMYNGTELLNDVMVQRLFADFYTNTNTAIGVEWKQVQY